MLLIKVLLKEVTEDESVIPIFEMGEGCNDIKDVMASMKLIHRQLRDFAKRRMALGDE